MPRKILVWKNGKDLYGDNNQALCFKLFPYLITIAAVGYAACGILDEYTQGFAVTL